MEVQGTDSKNYKTVGKVELLWCKESQYKSYYETFYVIEEKTPMVIMGAPSFTPEKRPASQPISPIGLGKQTPGMTSNGMSSTYPSVLYQTLLTCQCKSRSKKGPGTKG